MRPVPVLALILAASAVAAPSPAPLALGPAQSLAGGKLQVRPLEGMKSLPPMSPGVEAFFLGEVADHGPVSLVVLFVPEATGLPTDPASAQAYTLEVAGGLEEPELLSAQLLGGGGIEMEFLIDQFVGGETKRMYMVQRQLPRDGGLYNLTAMAMAPARDVLARPLLRALDSFGPPRPAPRTFEERLAMASQAMTEARLDDALALAEGVPAEAPFPIQVAGYRIRFSALVSQGRLRDVRSLVSPFMDTWRRDSRPFSSHYNSMLRRGLQTFLERLHTQERLDLDVGARAVLGQVALTAWAGPAEMIPPRITERQDQFFAALQQVGESQGPAMAAAWQALAPSLKGAASEVEGFLRKSAGSGTVFRPDEADYQWLESALFLPLVAALHQGDRDRYQELLRLFQRVGRRPSGFPVDPTSALAKLADRLEGKSLSFREMAFQIWSTAGAELYDRTRDLLLKDGLAGLVERSLASLEDAR